MFVGFNFCEGFILYDISYDGWLIVYWVLFVEMVVFYGIMDKGYFWKNVFDIGEYGIGKFVNLLKFGCDCFGVIFYFDVYFVMMDGNVVIIENVICIYEEDVGLLWKYWDFCFNNVELCCVCRLVVFCIVMVVNYEYGLFWYFYMDGLI